MSRGATPKRPEPSRGSPIRTRAVDDGQEQAETVSERTMAHIEAKLRKQTPHFQRDLGADVANVFEKATAVVLNLARGGDKHALAALQPHSKLANSMRRGGASMAAAATEDERCRAGVREAHRLAGTRPIEDHLAELHRASKAPERRR